MNSWYLRYEVKKANKIYAILFHIYIVLCLLSRERVEVGSMDNQRCEGIYSAFMVQFIFGFVRGQRECLFVLRALADNCTMNTQIKNSF